MYRLLFICLSACFIVFAPDTSHAAGIAVISNVDIAPYREAIKGFREQVRLPIREYHLGAKNENLDEVRRAVYEQHPELIFTLGKQALYFSREFARSAPVVFIFVLHPEDENGEVQESGISMIISPVRQLASLLKLVPGVKNVGLVYDPGKSNFLIRQYQLAARKMGVNLLSRKVNNAGEASIAVNDLMQRVDAFWMMPDTTIMSSANFRQMLALSLQYNVPLLGFASKQVRAGALLGLGFENEEVGMQAGKIALRILRSRSHEGFSLFLFPDHANLYINKKTAEFMGLDVPESLYQQAAKIYE